MATHEVKSTEPHFEEIAEGRKTAELRLDDRGYAVGDTLVQREIAMGEYTGRYHYTGRRIAHLITHKLVGGPWLTSGYCMLSLSREPVERLHIDGRGEDASN